MEFHDRALGSLCHCCGKRIKENDEKYNVENMKMKPNSIEMNEINDVCFQWLCSTCHSKSFSGNTLTPFQLRRDHGPKWMSCYLLRQQLRPGRRLKKYKFPESRNISGSFIPEEGYSGLNRQFGISSDADEIYHCDICNNLISLVSVQTPCQHFFCTFCVNKIFKAVGRETIECYSCSESFSKQDLKPVPLIVEQSLKRVPLQCNNCKEHLVLSETTSHKCKTVKEQAFKKIVNAVQEIQCTSSINEVCPKELTNMAHNLVRKELQNGKMALATQGRPLKIVTETQSGSTKPVNYEVKEPMDAQKCLGIMNACRINWSQQRALRRFCPGLFASERQMRICQEQIVGNFLIKSMEYMFVKREGATSIGGLNLEEVAVVRLTNIKELIYDYLNQYDMSDELNFNNGEIFVKFGGDKGGDTTKFELQICGLEKPNALHNIIVVLVFQAPDLTVNIEKGLKLVIDEVMDLDGSQWISPKTKKTHNIRLFFFGDYDFLCRVYGLIGPNGKYSCIYCYSSQDDIRSNNKPQGNRCLKTYNCDYKCFVDHGKDPRKSKNVSHSVIRPYMVDIELNMVSIPALHISLGLFKKMYDMLEKDIHNLDLIIFNMRQDASIPTGNHLADFDKKVAEAAANRSSCTERIQSLDEDLHELRNKLSLSLVEQEHDADEIALLGHEINLKEQEVEDLRTTMNQELKFGSGPLSTKMDEVLRKNKIPRQQYHGKSFVGNHVYRACKFNVIEKLMDGVEMTLKQQIHHCPANCKRLLEIKLHKIRESFTPVFNTFSEVHACINHTRCIDDSEIDAYENSIKLFSKEYRRIAPGVIQPKLHMLEHHSIPFMRQWKVGIGLLAEQGGELIHAEFNRRKRAVYGLRSNLDQLMSIMKSHLTFTSPEIQHEVIQAKKCRKVEE